MVESITIEIVEIGTISVGKTCLSERFVSGAFSEKTFPTVGSGLTSKNVEIGDFVVTMNIWDTAGSERYRSLVPIYVKNANLALVVFDVTSRESFNEIDKWIEFASENGPEKMILCLVGNKCDLENRQIGKEEAEEFAKRVGMPYFETSAKTGQGVEKMFLEMAGRYIEQHEQTDRGGSGDALEGEEKIKKCC